jgi:DNA (cytosine-5)-methyltransferase 1
MTAIIMTKLGENRGSPRIWLQGEKLEKEGYRAGDTFRIEESKSSRLVLVKNGDRKVSGKKRGDKRIPIIDLNTQQLAELFDADEKLKVAIRKGKIVITKHYTSGQVAERLERIRAKVREGKKLAVHSHYHGAGVLDLAIHSGFAKAGVNTYCQVAIELDREYLDISMQRNKHLFDDESIFIEGPIQDVRCDPRVKADIVLAGIPCTGASLAGRAKMRDTKGEKRTYHPEEHDGAGSLFFYTLRYIEVSQPGIVIIENVKAYASTASAAVIRSVLDSLGYRVQERVLGGNEFGALENRERLCLVGITKGLDDVIDIDDIVPTQQKPEKLSDVLEFIPEESPMWSEMEYLAKKEKRDAEKGNSFARQLFTGEEPKISTVTRQYIKRRSTDPFIQSPWDPKKSRLLTRLEHCRVKGIPEHLVDDPDISETRAHEVLGQSIVFPMFEAVGYALGASIQVAYGKEIPNPIAA